MPNTPALIGHGISGICPGENCKPQHIKLAPDGDPAYTHSMEGPDDMPAHIRSVLTCSELTIPIRKGRLALGTWQGVFLWEHRIRSHRRRIDVTVIA